jgi:amino acid adenylation domain-containing protein
MERPQKSAPPDRYAGTLLGGFLCAARRFPERPALEVDGASISYAELEASAKALAAVLASGAHETPAPRRTAVLAQRSEVAFVGVLAALLREHGYVPLHPGFPVARTRQALIRSGAATLVVDARGEKILPELLTDFPRALHVCLPHRRETVDLGRRFPGHLFSSPDGGCRPAWVPPTADLDRDGLAYLLFTSGSTGRPKGVLISHRSADHYVRCMLERYPLLDETARCSHTFDLTFDLSVHDLFVTWSSGACLVCPTDEELMFPPSYIDRAKLTVWFSVPSGAATLDRLGALPANRFPELRLSLFCGEGLPASVAAAWQRAAPASRVENLYGPTELTIACAAYTWDPVRSPRECHNGLVPIGAPLADMRALVVDEGLCEVPPGEAGELLVAGPQRAIGYLDDQEADARAFVRLPGEAQSDSFYYRTGDRVRRPSRADEPLLFLGRADSQVKVRGFRVELGEIEAALREESGIELAAVIAWPLSAAGAEGTVAFLEATARDVSELQRRLQRRLPSYMQPQSIRLVPKMPLNANGKIDRGALRQFLNGEPSP